MKKNRVIGMIGVGLSNSNWNADFTGYPKKINGRYVATPFCLKYCYRNYWDIKGESVLGLKSYDEKRKPLNLEERLTYLGIDFSAIRDKKNKNNDTIKKEQLYKLFDFIDVACFGATIAVKDFNHNFTGAIQFSEGINLFDDSDVVTETVLSPYQNSNKEESQQTTNGQRHILDEGHYFYDFVVDPQNYRNFADCKGFDDTDYDKFKEASLQCVNNYNSVAKQGCYNEFAMFIELKDASYKLITNLKDLVKCYKEEDKLVIDINNVLKELKEIEDDIASIEVYYSPLSTNLNYDNNIFNTDNLIITKNLYSEKDFDLE